MQAEKKEAVKVQFFFLPHLFLLLLLLPLAISNPEINSFGERTVLVISGRHSWDLNYIGDCKEEETLGSSAGEIRHWRSVAARWGWGECKDVMGWRCRPCSVCCSLFLWDKRSTVPTGGAATSKMKGEARLWRKVPLGVRRIGSPCIRVCKAVTRLSRIF